MAISSVIFFCYYLYSMEKVDPTKPSGDYRSVVQGTVFLLAWVSAPWPTVWCKILERHLTGESLLPVNELSDLTIHWCFCLGGLRCREHIHITFKTSPGMPRHHGHSWVVHDWPVAAWCPCWWDVWHLELQDKWSVRRLLIKAVVSVITGFRHSMVDLETWAEYIQA